MRCGPYNPLFCSGAIPGQREGGPHEMRPLHKTKIHAGSPIGVGDDSAFKVQPP